MKKAAWRKHHKWFGLILSFFIIMFCVSGLVLNHAELFSNVNISRSVLPSDYRYTQWNGGLLRGTMRWQKQVLIYGNSGIWRTEPQTHGDLGARWRHASGRNMIANQIIDLLLSGS